MKKTLSALLVLVLLVGLCACGKNSTQNTDPSTTPTQAPTENTQEVTISTTAATQAPTQETAADLTEEPSAAPTAAPTLAPTEEVTAAPTTKATAAPTTVPTACSHSYEDAACTAPKICTKCGKTEGDALGHSYKDATCSAPKTCTKCGETLGDALGHSFEDATCIAPKTCIACGATEGGVGEHNYVNGVCDKCNAKQIVDLPLDAGTWWGFQKGNLYPFKLRLKVSEGKGSFDGEFYAQVPDEHLEAVLKDGCYEKDGDIFYCNDLVEYEGKYYYSQGFGGDSCEFAYTDNNGTVILTEYDSDGYVKGSATLRRISQNQYIVDEVPERGALCNLDVGTVFTKASAG